ncbi:MAG: hypothetical protein CVT49_01980 [candidate division Zixibacteria bacterium HGW-Zixibacteria-1]|nr:MAG: hypothetical protein CVT49_01980 [candidate division Zixibacteria bacterium HGW-Zixibacteria-1]
MKRKLTIIALFVTSLFLCSITAHSLDKMDESIDYSKMTPSELHKIMAEMKAGNLEKSRAFAATADKAISLYNQNDYDVGFYTVDITVHLSDTTISGDVLVEATVVAASVDTVELDFYANLTTDSVYNTTGQLGFSHSGTKLIVALDRTYSNGEVFSFSVAYHGRPTGSGLDGFSFDFRNNQPVITTLSEPMSARTWWPCKDRPDDKADSMDIFVTCDTNLYCASNGTLIDTVRNGDGTWTFSYQERYPISTYLFSLAISNYVVWEDWYHYGDNDSMVIVNHVYMDRYSTSLIGYGITPYAIGVFADLFGEYPFTNEKYGHANFEWGGAMEHQTVSSMNGSSFGFTEPVVVHELSHQWWGDMITIDNWHEIWLNEGFASYCEALYYEVKDGKAAYHSYMNDMFYTYGSSIYVVDTTDVWNIFSRLVYDKGAWVLHMLRHIVGDSVFFDCMRAYYNSDFQYGNATTAGFQDICETVSGKDLDYFFEDWIYGTYFPKYMWSFRSEYDPSDGRYFTYLQLRQGQTTAPLVFRMPIDIVFTNATGLDTTVIFNDVRDTIYIMKNDQLPTNVQLDPDSWIHRYSYKSNWTYHLIPFPLDTAQQFMPYLDSVVAKGGTDHHSYKITGGALPLGLTLDSLTGFITGMPTQAGTFNFDVYAKDLMSSYNETRTYTLVVEASPYIPGDADNSGNVNLLDITFLINYLYKGGAAPAIPNAVDADGSCAINLLDASYLITYMYRGGSDPLPGCVE